MYSCEAKLKFSASLHQSSVSRDPAEILLICWFIMSVETVVLLNCFWNMENFSLINTKVKTTEFIQNKKLF